LAVSGSGEGCVAWCVLGRETPVRKRLPAFTLIELLIVLLILGIVAAMVIPMVSGTDDAQCEAAARVIVADLELAQSTALARQAEVALVFSDDGQSYKVVLSMSQDLSDYASLVTLEHPLMPGQTYEVNVVTDLQLPDVVLSGAAFGGDGHVVFDSFGSPGFGGSVVVTAGAASLTVSVEPITGAVSVN